MVAGYQIKQTTSIGIDHDGKKEILGLWIGKSEGARFLLGVFQELKNRGVRDFVW
jgi:transposase-like protein